VRRILLGGECRACGAEAADILEHRIPEREIGHPRA